MTIPPSQPLEISFVHFQLFLTQREYTAEFLRVKSLHRTNWLDSIPAGSENLLYHIYDRIQSFLPSSSHLNGTDSSSQNSLQGKLTGNIHNLKGQTVVFYRFSFQTVVVYDVKPLFIIIHRQHPLFWTSTSQFRRVNPFFCFIFWLLAHGCSNIWALFRYHHVKTRQEASGRQPHPGPWEWGNWLPWSAKKGKATWMDVIARLLVGYIPIYCWRKSI